MSASATASVRRRPTRLVGRDAELALLEAELHRDGAPGLRVALVTGDPGVGKTRLADEVAHRRRRGAAELSARGHLLGATASFGLWAEALERHLRTLTPDQIEAACGGFADDLSALLHGVAAVRPRAMATPPRARLLEGLAVLLESAAGGGRLLVVLDDVHLADPSSWDALHFLSHRITDAHVLVIATARPAELARNAAAAPVLADLGRDGALLRIELAPLDTAAVGALAEAVLGQSPPALVRWLDGRCRGNPLFAGGLLRALRESGAPLDRPRLDSLPADLADLVLPRVRSLDAVSRDLVDLLAVAGGRVELSELQDLSGLEPDLLADRVQELAESRLLVEDERNRRITCEIAHPLIQEVVYGAIGPARRRSLHRRLGRALLAAHRLGEAASHFARSADPGDAEAVTVLLGALREAEQRGAHREGLDILGALLDVLPAGDPRWIDALDALADGLEWIVNHLGDTRAVVGAAAMRRIDAVLVGSGDAARAAKAKFRLASFQIWGTGELDEATVHCAEAAELFEAAGDPRAARFARFEQAACYAHQEDLPRCVAAAERVLAEAESSGDPYALLQSTFLYGIALFLNGRLDQGSRLLGTSGELAAGQDQQYRLVVARVCEALCQAYAGDLVAAHGALAAGQAIDCWRDSVLAEWRTIVDWLAGDFAAAVSNTEQSAERHPAGLGRRRSLGLPFAALAAVETGQLDAAHRFLAEARQHRPMLLLGPATAHADGVLAWRTGHLDRALAQLRSSADDAAAKGCRHVAGPVLLDLAEVAANANRADLARAAASDLADPVGDLGQALAVLAGGWAHLAEGRPDPGPLAGAADFLGERGYRALYPRALELHGRSLAATRPAAAIGQLTAALDVFDACGATWRAERARTTLRGLGRHGRRAAAGSGTVALTPRERQVAELAVQGLSVRRIAQSLVIGEHTAETHLRNIYAKLGVRSKAELVGRDLDG